MPAIEDIHVTEDLQEQEDVNAHPSVIIGEEPIADAAIVLTELEPAHEQPIAEPIFEEDRVQQEHAEIEWTRNTQSMPVAEQGQAQKSNPLSFVNRPWLLITIPLLGGSIWLANNPWIITQNMDKPYVLLAGPTFVASIIIGWMLITFFRTIATWCTTAWHAFNHARKEDSSAQFFWVVIIVFMLVSVFASGSFFSMLEHNSLPLLGYATALFIDLVAVQAMRARLNAVRMRDRKGAGLYLFGVLLCAGASAFANVYTSLADFDQRVTGSLPPWMLYIAPWFGLVFPALILLLSVTADYTIDQISSKLDPEQYREQEGKRIKLLEYQRDALRERVSIENEIDQLTAQLQGKKEQRVFFLINWFFPARPKEQGTQSLVEEVMVQLLPRFQQLDEKSSQTFVTLQQAHRQAIGELKRESEQIHLRFRDIVTDTHLRVNGWSEIPGGQDVNRIQHRQEGKQGQKNEFASVKRALAEDIGEKLESLASAETDALKPDVIDIQEWKEDKPVLSSPTEGQESAISLGDIVSVDGDQFPEQHTEELHLPEGTFLDRMSEIHIQKEGDQYGEREKTPESVYKRAVRISGTMTYGEVAKKFSTTVAIVEDAIQKGDLKLSKRGPNKILVSSLSNFTPPKRRRRRMKTEAQVEEMAL